VLAPLDEGRKLRWLSLGDGLDVAVGEILHPAGEAEAAGFLAGIGAKGDSLNETPYDEMKSGAGHLRCAIARQPRLTNRPWPKGATRSSGGSGGRTSLRSRSWIRSWTWWRRCCRKGP